MLSANMDSTVISISLWTRKMPPYGTTKPLKHAFLISAILWVRALSRHVRCSESSQNDAPLTTWTSPCSLEYSVAYANDHNERRKRDTTKEKKTKEKLHFEARLKKDFRVCQWKTRSYTHHTHASLSLSKYCFVFVLISFPFSQKQINK